MRYTITATDRDGFETYTTVINLDVFRKDVDIVEACKEAAREYVSTKEGLQVYIEHCEWFNWADFDVYVPNKICEKYGFRKIDSDAVNIDVILDEQLAEPTFLVTNIQWDADTEDDDVNLPRSYYIPISELLLNGEELEDVDTEAVKDRVADYLSDTFGFCVFGMSIT